MSELIDRERFSADMRDFQNRVGIWRDEAEDTETRTRADAALATIIETKLILDKQPTIAAPRWVRCEERLPDDTFKQVLITDGTHFGLAYCLDLGVYGVKWRKTNWMSIGGLFRGKITHWMPIEPPKEDA